MSPHLVARQTPQPLATGLTQPTTTLALSTTFTPPTSCLLPSQITILPSPGFLIWNNEPVPFPGKTASACYPSEWLRSYTSVAPTTSLALGSSIVPAMSPLVCPVGFCTQYVGTDNYIACCPSGYKFATIGTPVVKSRPAYGGICYTDIRQGEELTAMMYDASGSSHQEIWAPSTSGAQGWAHPIDGWAASSAAVGCAERSTTSGSGSSTSTSVGVSSVVQTSVRPLSSSVSSAKKKSKKASGGVIAGAVLGALVGLIAILSLVLFLLRKKKQSAAAEEKGPHIDDGTRYQTDGTQIHQKDGDDARVEVNAVGATTELGPSQGANAHELGTGDRIAELPAGIDVRAGQR